MYVNSVNAHEILREVRCLQQLESLFANPFFSFSKVQVLNTVSLLSGSKNSGMYWRSISTKFLASCDIWPLVSYTTLCESFSQSESLEM